MKILYGIQATGNGHTSRAMEILPEISKKAAVDILISGQQADISLPFDIKYYCHGLGFYFGKNGGVDILRSISNIKAQRLIQDIKQSALTKYDLIISDFEPISAWSAKKNNIPCINLSHQASLLSAKCPQPNKINPIAKSFIRNYSPSNGLIGFHFESYDDYIFTPIIRKSIRELNPYTSDHISVYLPSFHGDGLLELFLNFPSVRWKVFDKHSSKKTIKRNVEIFPISNAEWLQNLESCRAAILGAGFEGPAEALYLGKPLLAVPMKNQYEQKCNAAALRKLGVQTSFSNLSALEASIKNWLPKLNPIKIDFEDCTEAVVQKILNYNFSQSEHCDLPQLERKKDSSLSSI